MKEKNEMKGQRWNLEKKESSRQEGRLNIKKTLRYREIDK